MKDQENAQQRIKEAARKLFQEKGFDAVRTREIAEAAGINSALLHYYYRSKDKLFRIIMSESIHEMFSFMGDCINDRSTSLDEKINVVVNGYIDVIKGNPNIALFVLNELHSNPLLLLKEAGVSPNFVTESHLFEQIEEQLRKNGAPFSPLHIILNTISLSVMPIIAAPMVKYMYQLKEDNITAFLEDRRRLIPIWIKGMLQIEN
jgi:AcrR family transcriptional regulator